MPDHELPGAKSATSLSPAEREAIVRRGWATGAIVPESLDGGVNLAPGAIFESGDVWIVISQSCDIAALDLDAEPCIELIRARRVNSLIAARAKLRNPRVLHFEAIENGQQVILESWARDRAYLDRRELIDCSADSKISLPEVSLTQISTWLSRRYSRVAFPDAFNERMAVRRKQIRRFQEKTLNHLQGIWVRVDPMEELPPDQDYRLVLRAVIRSDAISSSEARTKFKNEVFDPFVNVLRATDGIKLEDFAYCFSDQFTFNDQAELDFLDYDFDLHFPEPLTA